MTEENSTSVSIYLPEDTFYDFFTHEKVEGKGDWVTLNDVAFTTMPLHIRAGTIIPLREAGANTTTELRAKDFVLYVAVDSKGRAEGKLYLDEGDAVVQDETSVICFEYDNGRLSVDGTFGFKTGLVVREVTVMGGAGNKTGGYETAGAKSRTFEGVIGLGEKSVRVL